MEYTTQKLYELLYERYGKRNWWPAKTPYEVMVGAILTQNTAWRNVEKAIANFGTDLSPEFVASIPVEQLCEIIRPAGFFNQKSVYLKTLTSWFAAYGYSVTAVRAKELPAIRKELLSLRGIGSETADSILLYAFGFPVFVVDAYTLRLLKRLSASEEKLGYDETRMLFMRTLEPEKYNNAHALIVELSKDYCKAKPLCDGCPLTDICNFYL